MLPTHMLVQLQAGVPVWTALGWFITNASEALIGAFCIARFTHPRKTLDNVRGVFTFVVFGVVLAPLATSFLDAAAVVITGWGPAFWPLGVERFWTNALAELTLVPLIVLWSSNGISWLRSASISQYLEAALLAVGTWLVAVMVFGSQLFSPSTTPGLLYLPLPFLLWAAARFGLGGLSFSLLSVALISIRYTMHGREPFPYVSMAQNVLSLQILLCVVAVPLMFLSAVMAEARRTQDSLRRTRGGLIEALEQERHRIARELHDDIVQRLALVSLELEGVQEDIPDVACQFRSRIGALGNQTTQIADDVQLLSHELHSSKLEYLGIVEATKNFCKEFSERQKAEIDFQSHDLPDALPTELSLSLYRVVQEALRNAKKHSGVKRFEVRLWGSLGEIHLSISDLGAGFDPENRNEEHGAWPHEHARAPAVNAWRAFNQLDTQGLAPRSTLAFLSIHVAILHGRLDRRFAGIFARTFCWGINGRMLCTDSLFMKTTSNYSLRSRVGRSQRGQIGNIIGPSFGGRRF